MQIRREICQLPLRRQDNKPNLLTRLQSFHEHGYCLRQPNGLVVIDQPRLLDIAFGPNLWAYS
jgi:hypothetical protein